MRPPACLVRSRPWGRLILSLLVVLPLLGARPAAAEEQETFEKAHERYEAWVRRATLHKRNMARERLARTGDARALPILIRDYDKPETPKDHVRYLVATMAATWLGHDAKLLPQWIGWRKRYAQPSHAWLWYQTSQVEARLRGKEAGDALAAADDEPLLQAAALRSLADAFAGKPQAPAVADLALALGLALPKAPDDRGAVVEAQALVLATLKLPWKEAKAVQLAEQLIGSLADKTLPERSRLVVARALGRAFASEAIDLDPEIWRRELAAAQSGTPPTAPPPDRYAGPRFVGLPTSGKRIVYVIDLSDSMLIPLVGAEKESLQKPATPKEGTPAAPKPADDLPWDKIATRFDAARECLKASLQRLDKERRFCVVIFGDKAELLESTPQLMAATTKAIKATIRELDQLELRSTKKTAAAPHGELRGATNLHGGLRMAFQVGSKGLVETNEHVDAKLLEDGCDTIFLLSDGVPSWDDFEATEVPDPEDQPANPESKADTERTPTMTYDGPYGQFHATGDYLVQDVRRMNLLRNAEIHVVAVGEADDLLLARIADLGLGKVRRVGAAPGEPAPR